MSYDPTSTEGVPEHGRERLAQMRGGFFTSDLSVNEFLLVKQAGFDPLGLVIGSSIYHIGYQQSSWKQSMEMGVLSQAMYEARELAMTRMEEEADQLGADGIVGVRLDIGRYEWGEHLAEFIAIGTAVKHREGVMHRAPNGRPFTSDLTGQDFWTLLASGRHGLVRLPRRPSGNVRVDAADRAERRDAELHPGLVRRARARDGAHAEGSRGASGGRHRRGATPGALARVGIARDRVLCRRHGDRPVRRRREPARTDPDDQPQRLSGVVNRWRRSSTAARRRCSARRLWPPLCERPEDGYSP
jgi:uncharacterized protein YbjQ (UPF0145 family)